MAIAERLVARVSFSQKLTGPERGPSWARASGVAGGGWKGVLRGAASPKQHPPSPVWKTHHLKSKTDLRQALREPQRSDTPALAAFLLKDTRAGSAGDTTSSPLPPRQGNSRCLALPSPGRQALSLRQGSPLRKQAGSAALPPSPVLAVSSLLKDALRLLPKIPTLSTP